MSDLPVSFSPDTARRVLNATRTVEGDRQDLTGRPTPGRLPVAATRYPVKITGASRDGDNWRWVYTGVPQVRTAAGHAGTVDDERFDGPIELYNAAEDPNGSDRKIDRVPDGLIVDAWFERYREAAAVEVQWRFFSGIALSGDGSWIDVTEYEVSHIGPELDDAPEPIAIPIEMSLEGCTLALKAGKIQFDARGHFLGFGALETVAEVVFTTKSVTIPRQPAGGSVTNCVVTLDDAGEDIVHDIMTCGGSEGGG